MTTLANLGLNKTGVAGSKPVVNPTDAQTALGAGTQTQPQSAPEKVTAKPSESALPGDDADVAAAKLGDERADADTRTLEERPQVEPTEAQKQADAVVEHPMTVSEQRESFLHATEALRETVVQWSSHPIAKYTVGDFQFQNGLLVLRTQKEADEFQAVYDELPIYEQSRIHKLDLDAAEAMVRAHMAQTGGATKGIDSATGDRAPNNQTGRGRLEDQG